MASIKIRQNIFGYEKKRKGFTQRQIVSAAIALIILVGMFGGLTFGLGIGYEIAMTIGFVSAIPAIIAGFMPIFNMRAEEFCVRYFKHLGHKGLVLCLEESHVEGGELSRVYQKQAKKEKGFECRDSV